MYVMILHTTSRKRSRTSRTLRANYFRTQEALNVYTSVHSQTDVLSFT